MSTTLHFQMKQEPSDIGTHLKVLKTSFYGTIRFVTGHILVGSHLFSDFVKNDVVPKGLGAIRKLLVLLTHRCLSLYVT